MKSPVSRSPVKSLPSLIHAGVFFRSVAGMVAGFAAPLVSGTDVSGSSERTVPYAMTTYGVEEGLPDPVAMTVLQTHDGFLWTGTDYGLARFDGNEFKTYRTSSTPGLAHDRIRCLFEDSRGVLWVGTHNGVSLLRDGKFERLPNLDVPVTTLAEDRTGRILIGTRTQGLFEWQNGVVHPVPLGLRTPGRAQISALFTDSAGRVWIGLGMGPPVYLEGGSVHRTGTETSHVGTPAFVEQPRGTVWFAEGPSLVRWHDGVLYRYGKEAGMPGETIAGIGVDPAGEIWFTAGRQVCRLESANARTCVPVAVPALRHGRQLAFDREGNCWIGTAGFGLVKLRASGFEEIALPGAEGQSAATIAVDRRGVVSVSLIPNGIVRIAPGAPVPTRIDTGEGLAHEVFTVFSDRDNRLWIGRRSSVLVWDEGKFVEYPEAAKVHSLYEDHEGAMWLGTENNGVLRYKDGVFERMNSRLRLRDGTTAAAFAECGGALFIGLMNGGLVQLRGGEATHYGTEGSPRIDIRALLPDRAGNLWIGTRTSGVGVFQDGQLWFSSTLPAPFEGLVSALQLDDADRLFVGGARGIYWGPRTAVLAALRGNATDSPFLRAAESEGLRAAIVGFGQLPTSAKDTNGRLWFATRTGLVVVDPARIVSNPIAPAVHLLRASHGERTIEIANGVLVLPPDAGAVRIDYTAAAFARPDLVRFRYRLEDEESEWTEAGGRRFAIYNRVPVGKHRFHVIAANESGVWNETGAILSIDQRPHFHQTLAFRIVLFSAVALAIGIVARWWTRRSLKRQLDALEAEQRLERERTRIARDLHDEIGGSVTKIGYLVDRLEMQRSAAETQRLQQQLCRQTRLLASDLDRVVWSVNSTNGTLRQLGEFIATFVQTFLRDTDVHCSTKVTPTLPSLPVAPEIQHHVLAVIKEAVNNALKHATPTHIGVEVSADDKSFAVTVQDDGCGFDAEAHPYAERNGLRNMRARISEIGGELVLVTAPGRGTTISLRIPLSAFSPANA